MIIYSKQLNAALYNLQGTINAGNRIYYYRINSVQH